MDGLGAVSLVGGITCLLLALQWGGQTSPWRSVKIIGLLTGSAALSALLGFLQGKLGEHATIPLRILRQRSILMGCIFIALLDLTAYTVSGVRPWHAFTRLMCTVCVLHAVLFPGYAKHRCNNKRRTLSGVGGSTNCNYHIFGRKCVQVWSLCKSLPHHLYRRF